VACDHGSPAGARHSPKLPLRTRLWVDYTRPTTRQVLAELSIRAKEAPAFPRQSHVQLDQDTREFLRRVPVRGLSDSRYVLMEEQVRVLTVVLQTSGRRASELAPERGYRRG